MLTAQVAIGKPGFPKFHGDRWMYTWFHGIQIAFKTGSSLCIHGEKWDQVGFSHGFVRFNLAIM